MVFSRRSSRVKLHIWGAVLAALLSVGGPAFAEQVHIVGEGHTLGRIAKRYNTTVEAICAANRITQRTTLRLGQKLVIPDPPNKRPAKASSPTERAQSPSPAAPAAPPTAASTASPPIQSGATEPTVSSPPKPGTASQPPRANTPFTTHRVIAGNTLGKIAQRYQTTVESIQEANQLDPRQTLRVGTCLVVPVTESNARRFRSRPCNPNTSAIEKGQTSTDSSVARMLASRAGILHLVRGDTSFQGRLLDNKGQPIPAAMARVDRLLFDRRSTHTHPTSVALLRKLTEVSNHFGGNRIIIISGYREESSNRYTTRSNHARGRAIDFRVENIPNEELRDFCHTLTGVGVGYYPNSSFVHLDVRSITTHWTDISGPGEAPNYTSVVAPAAPANQRGKKR